MARKKEMKKVLFKEVADQCGRIFSENILTIVWARRFAAYKRADLILRDLERFKKMVQHPDFPVQFIWAGKPYPEDQDSINRFNDIFYCVKEFSNCAVLTGYEIGLSGLLKRGSDIWLNNPKMFREASGTSGMTAAMNGSINLSIADGWVPEFAADEKNSFLIPHAADQENSERTDQIESENLYAVLEKKIIPLYYTNPKGWSEIMMRSMRDVTPEFESGRMASAYYKLMYC